MVRVAPFFDSWCINNLNVNVFSDDKNSNFSSDQKKQANIKEKSVSGSYMCTYYNGERKYWRNTNDIGNLTRAFLHLLF